METPTIIIEKIEQLDHLGRGIIKGHGPVIFVENVAIGDIVKVKIKQQKKKYAIGEVETYLEKSPNRNETFCPYQNRCGGCAIGHLSYEEQLKFKKEKIKNIFRNHTEIKINDVVPSIEVAYRNKVTFHIKGGKIGYFKEKTNELIEIDACKLITQKMNDILKKLKKVVSQTKELGSVMIRSTEKKETMLCILHKEINEMDVKEEFKEVDVIYLNDKLIQGTRTIQETINNCKFMISNHSFFQINKSITENMYQKAIESFTKKNYTKILDLYCGTGTIGMILSKHVKAKEIIGIEIEPTAVSDANQNKQINEVKNIRFIEGKVENNLKVLKDVEAVVVDPPRSGLHTQAIKDILKIAPKEIVYISCDPITLLRDIELLMPEYEAKELTPFDMFPNTYHVETVCYLSRKETSRI